MNLFIDDEKKPEWYDIDQSTLHIATSYEAALSLIQKNTYSIIYLDHDLGCLYADGSILLQRYMMLGKNNPQKVYCLSWNPVGIERIRFVCKDYGIPFEVLNLSKFYLQMK
jgi:hypothetical protein